MPYFECDARACEHLAGRDPLLGGAITRIGPLRRELRPDLFAALADSIVSQQISGRAADAVLARLTAFLGEITPEAVVAVSDEALRGCGMSLRKAGYLKGAAEAFRSGAVDPEALRRAGDGEVAEALTALRGVGAWTAEMLLIFSLGRPDVLSFGDFGIRKGISLLHGHERVDRPLFERYRALYSPYGTAASLYLWAVAGGA